MSSRSVRASFSRAAAALRASLSARARAAGAAWDATSACMPRQLSMPLIL
jgi:hypothetical protein